MQQYAEILLLEVGERQAPEFKSELQRILTAIANLRSRIEGSEPTDGIQAERTLRHDIGNLLAGIKGTGEWLSEELADRQLTDSLATLQALVQEATALQHSLARSFRPREPAVETSAGPSPRKSASQRAQSTVLVVDDDEMNQSVLRHKLDREGYRVETVGSGIAALQRLESSISHSLPSVDLILLDLLMPDMSGDQVLERLRGEPRWRDIPVIIISAWDDLKSIVRCIERGAEDYLIKPFESALLRARIGSALEKRWLRQRERDLLQREIDQAIQIQRSLMSPPAPMDSPIDGYNRPVRYVSGDFFQHFRRPDGIIPFALGDVAGKGFDAALLMAKVAGLFRYLSKSGDDCSALLATLNRELYEHTSPKRFVTAVVGFFDPESARISFANAGHVPPILIAADGSVQQYPAKAPPLGVLPQAQIITEQIQLPRGSAFYIVSDGFIECYAPGGQVLNMEGLIPLLQQVQNLPLKQRLDRLFESVTASGWRTQDDLTMLAIVPG